MTDVVDELREIEAIKQLKARYFRLLDTKQWDELSDIFCDDCHAQYLSEVLVGRAAIMAFLVPAMSHVVSAHHGHMPEIEITSAVTATGTWAMSDRVVSEVPGGAYSIQGYGHYHEEYRKEADGKWRICRLRLTRLRVDNVS